jgi:hypothetical protein
MPLRPVSAASRRYAVTAGDVRHSRAFNRNHAVLCGIQAIWQLPELDVCLPEPRDRACKGHRSVVRGTAVHLDEEHTHTRRQRVV